MYGLVYCCFLYGYVVTYMNIKGNHNKRVLGDEGLIIVIYINTKSNHNMSALSPMFALL